MLGEAHALLVNHIKSTILAKSPDYCAAIGKIINRLSDQIKENKKSIRKLQSRKILG
jgi:hypothetical protein